VQRYKVEPYAVAADVYSVAPHVGRGGWTWYTGSAGWLYRAGIESILGFRLQGEFFSIDPCIPKAWPGFEMVYKHRSARYEIAVENPQGVSRGVASATLDGKALGAARVPLADDGAVHKVRVVLG
jgi:cyclic beta-1,2-glucan synthetase